MGQLYLSANSFYGENSMMPAQGQLLPVSQHQVLFSLLGVRYGGDGTSTFALPDLRGLGPGNTTWLICIAGIYP